MSFDSFETTQTVSLQSNINIKYNFKFILIGIEISNRRIETIINWLEEYFINIK